MKSPCANCSHAILPLRGSTLVTCNEGKWWDEDKGEPIFERFERMWMIWKDCDSYDEMGNGSPKDLNDYLVSLPCMLDDSVGKEEVMLH